MKAKKERLYIHAKSVSAAVIAFLAAVLLASGCGGGGGGVAPATSPGNINVSLNLPRQAFQSGSSYEVAIYVKTLNASGVPSSVAATATAPLVYDAANSRFYTASAVTIANIPVGANYFLETVINLASATSTVPVAFAGAVIDVADGAWGNVTVSPASSLATEAMMRYGTQNGVALASIPANLEGAISAVIAQLTMTDVNFSKSFYSSFLATNTVSGTVDPFAPSNWGSFAGMTAILDDIVTRARALVGDPNALLYGDYFIVGARAVNYSTTPSYTFFKDEPTCDGDGGCQPAFGYTTSADRTFTSTAPTGSTGVISETGDVFMMADTTTTDNSLQWVIGVRKGSGMTNASLSGAFTSVELAMHNSTVVITVYSVTFDGNGNGTSQEIAKSDGNPLASNNITYSLASDGTFSSSDCTGCGGILSADGNVFIEYDNDMADGWTQVAVAVKNGSGMSNADLSGNYMSATFYSEYIPSRWYLDTEIGTFYSGGAGSGTYTITSHSEGYTGARGYIYNIASTGTYSDNFGNPGILSGDGDVMLLYNTDSSDGSLEFMVAMKTGATGPPSNLAPSPTAAASPATGAAPLSVTFTGTCGDSDGTCASYSWDFGDSTPTSSSQNPTHTYASAGTYTATLTVTDNDGATAQDTVTVTVASSDEESIGSVFSAMKTAVNAEDLTAFSNQLSSSYLNNGRTKSSYVSMLQSFFNEGGSYSYDCSISSVNVNGNTATAILTGDMTATAASTKISNCRDSISDADLYFIKESGNWKMYGNQSHGYQLTGTGDATGTVYIGNTQDGKFAEEWSLHGGALEYDYTGLDIDYFVTATPVLNNSWTFTTSDYGYQRVILNTITSVSDTVVTSAGTFNNCVKVTRSYTYPDGYDSNYAQYQTITKSDWFAPGVGLVKYVVTHGDSSTNTMTLTSYNVPSASSSDYYPMAAGNSWTYQYGSESWTLTVTGMDNY